MIPELSEFSGKNVFITGHTGFKGSWLTAILHNVGANVLGFSLKPDDGTSLFESLGLGDKVSSIFADIRDQDKLTTAIENFKPEFVFHLAAQALVRPSYIDPIETFTTNFVGSMHILESVRQFDSVKSLIFVTSDKCYENRGGLKPYIESDKLGGHDPYSASKAAAEILFHSYLVSYFSLDRELGAASVRAGNVIGGGDWSLDRIVPDFIRSISTNIPVQLRNPDAQRPWQHVLEPLSGYLKLAIKLKYHPNEFSGSWNFGPNLDEVISVRVLIEKFIENYGTGSIGQLTTRESTHEATNLHLDSQKAAELLSWRPKWNIDSCVTKTSDWYQEVSLGMDPYTKTIAQIEEYFS